MVSVKAIFFDLDDTLVDTYGQLVPKAHRDACQAMIDRGLDVSLDDLYKKRLELLLTHPREEINWLLMDFYGYNQPHIAQAGIEAFHNPRVEGIRPFPGVPELLEQLSTEFLLFLVTTGYPATQRRKVEELGLGQYFRDIYYVNIAATETKAHAFTYLFQQFDLSPSEVLVVGDRLNNEIHLANQLGCQTIWVQHGEFSHLIPQHQYEWPDHTIDNICELLQILEAVKEPQA